MKVLYVAFAILFVASIAKGLFGVTLLTMFSASVLYLCDRNWQRKNPEQPQNAESQGNEPTPPDSHA